MHNDTHFRHAMSLCFWGVMAFGIAMGFLYSWVEALALMWYSKKLRTRAPWYVRIYEFLNK